MKTIILTTIMLAGILIVGCEPKTTNVDVINDQGGAVMQLDYRDFEQAASDMIQSMLKSGALNKPGGGRYVVSVGQITDDTMQGGDLTTKLMSQIETDMLNSGKAVITAAVGSGKDEMLQEVRELRNSDEFNQDTTVEKHTLVAPELTITGKIIQSDITVNRSTQRAEYLFTLKLSDVKTGLTLWSSGPKHIVKQGSSKSVPW